MQEPNSKLTLSPAPRRKLTETVAEQLLAAIRLLPPGAKVPSERELTKDLGVGRSTVREALNGLAMLGIVEIRHGRRRTDEDLASLAAALKVQEERLTGKIDDLVDVAASFNVLLAEAAHNEVLAAMIQSFVSLMVERGPRVYSLDGFGEWDLQEHRGLFEAVRDRDPDRAARLMREHIEELARRYRAVGAA
jgi:GntR family transcriptional repressor for pyruvate dehydrogenase complex